jgi:hypothetical protein
MLLLTDALTNVKVGIRSRGPKSVRSNDLVLLTEVVTLKSSTHFPDGSVLGRLSRPADPG